MGVEMKIKTTVLLGLLSFSVIFSSCNNQKKKKTYDADSIELTTDTSDETKALSDLISTKQKWHLTNKRVAILFGYDFNAAEVKEPLLQILSENFGLADEGGLIYPVTYPDDFKHGVRGYASDFTALLQSDELDLAGLVLLGAPENTHTALARNQDKWNQEVPYPVIALFPQDDVLGIESTCDIVVDKGQTAGLTGEVAPEESDGQIHQNAAEIIVETIRYIQLLDGAPSRTKDLQQHMAQMLEGFQFHHYTDPESGLQSINHFVLNN